MEVRRPYEVRLDKSAAKQLRRLPAAERERVKIALREEAARLSDPGANRGAKAVKTIRGRHDEFRRLRVGARRVLFDVDSDAETLLVLGIVARRDLDRWLRGR